MPAWAPDIPGTDINRMEFISLLLAVYKDRANRHHMEDHVRRLVSHRVLSARQIGGITGCGVQRVKRIAKGMGMSTPPNKGFLDPAALEGLFVINQILARGEQPTRQLIEEATKWCPGLLMEKLTSVPNSTYHNARRRQEARL